MQQMCIRDSGKDLRAVSATAACLPDIRNNLEKCRSERLSGIYAEFDMLADICKMINESINEDAPFSIRDGDIIRQGYSKDVDYLRSVMKDGKSWIEKIAIEEREKTGIKTLKIRCV